MKKYLSYILILVALIGLFSPTKTQAQVKKNCYEIPDGAGKRTQDNLTEKECTDLGGQWRVSASGNVQPPQESDNQDKAPVNTDTTYTPLAPLPGFLDAQGNAKPFETDPDKNPCAFGNYMNIMIKLLIGIAAVLAVLMIVIGGLEYMTSELISSKEHGKDRINNAILGLVIALGSWALLNTLNPKLLDVCLDKLPEAKITIDEAPPTAEDFNPNEFIPFGTIGSCSEGIEIVNTSGGSFKLCRKISNNFQTMINKAWAEGYKISGWGYRSNETQIALRTKNHCPDVYTSPSSQCKPPTAIPGTSMHESGLAIDLTCDGNTSIQTHDNRCFIWLQANAASFGLVNLSSEPWHWSINGK